MRSGLACSLMVLLGLVSSVGLAQTPPAATTTAPAPDSSPSAALPLPSQPPAPAPPIAPGAPAPAPAAPALPPAPPAGVYSCSLGDHGGIDPDSAATVAQIVCGEVSARGPQPGAAYVVHLRRLGETGVLSLEQRDATGRTVAQRQVVLQSIQEVPVAAPRLAESMLRGVPLEGTQRVNNLLEQETREQKRKWGATYWGIGVGGSMLPGGTSAVLPTLDLAVYHETERVAIGGDFRASASDSSGLDGDGGSFESLSVGGRYFTSEADVTPYIGGGLSWSFLESDDGDWHGDSNGFSFYAEGGVEALRTYQTRLVVGIRATLPVYQVKQNDYYVPPSTGSAYEEPKHEDRYVLPVSLTATMMF